MENSGIIVELWWNYGGIMVDNRNYPLANLTYASPDTRGSLSGKTSGGKKIVSNSTEVLRDEKKIDKNSNL